MRKLRNENLDYCSNVHPRSFPVGYDVECFTRELLDWADVQAQSPSYREHVTSYFNEPWQRIKLGNVAQDIDDSHTRLTLDYISDYVTIYNEML